MIAEEFESQTHILGAPQGWDALAHGPCVGLPVHTDGVAIYSCWTVSWREWFGLLFGQRIWLTLLSSVQPPVALEVHPRQSKNEQLDPAATVSVPAPVSDPNTERSSNLSVHNRRKNKTKPMY